MKPRASLTTVIVLVTLGVTVSGCQKVRQAPPPLEQQAKGPAVAMGKGPAANAEPTAAAPTAEVPRGNGQTIGVTLLTKTHAFYQDLEAGMREAADRLNLKLAVVSAEFKASEQDRQIDDFIVQKVAAMVVCPADSASVGGAIKKANVAGIPVFTADIAADEGEVVSHIASDNKQGGQLAGEYLAKAIGEEGEIIIIDHPAVRSVQDRVAGFEEAIARYPRIKIVDKAPAEGQRSKARDVTANKLIEFPHLKGIFGINDDSALGALAACEATKGAEEVVIVGYDATPEAREKILKGTQLKADAVQFPHKMGVVTIETVARFLAGQKVDKWIPIEVDIVDKEKLERAGGRKSG